MKNNCIEEVLLIISAISIMVFLYDGNMDFSYYNIFDFKFNLLLFAPLLFFARVGYIFYKKNIEEKKLNKKKS